MANRATSTLEGVKQLRAVLCHGSPIRKAPLKKGHLESIKAALGLGLCSTSQTCVLFFVSTIFPQSPD